VKVSFTLEARSSLQDIGDRIARDNPRRAELFVDELIDAAIAIGEAPRAFQLMDGFEALGVRRRVHGRYLIVFREVGDEIRILDVVHGARDPASMSFPED